MLNISCYFSARDKDNPLNVFRYDDTSLWKEILESAPRTIEDDLFYKYSRNLSNDVNGSLESSDLPFFPNEDERKRLFRGGSRLPFRPPVLLYRVLPRRHLPCQKLFPLEIYRSGENRGVISGRTKQRECRAGRSRSSFEE